MPTFQTNNTEARRYVAPEPDPAEYLPPVSDTFVDDRFRTRRGSRELLNAIVRTGRNHNGPLPIRATKGKFK